MKPRNIFVLVAMTTIASSSWAGWRKAYVIPGWVGAAPAGWNIVHMVRMTGYEPVVIRHPFQIKMARIANDAPIVAYSSGNWAALCVGVVPDIDVGALTHTGASRRIHGANDFYSRPLPGDFVIEGRGHLNVTRDQRAIELLRRFLDEWRD